MTKDSRAKNQRSVKKSFTYWLKIVLGLLFVLLLIVGGYYYLKGRQEGERQKNSREKESQNVLLSFQEILTKNCQMRKSLKGFSYYGIELSKLPIIIDETLLKIQPEDKQYVRCIGEKGHDYIFFEYSSTLDDSKTSTIYVYDDGSEELGHGGQPYLGSYGKIIKNEEGFKLSLYLPWGEGGPILTDEMTVVMRGEKKLLRADGEILYVNGETSIVDNNNPKLIEILNKYGKAITPEVAALYGWNFNDYQDKKMLKVEDNEAIVEEIATAFFSDMDNLGSVEEEQIKKLEQILNSVIVQ